MTTVNHEGASESTLVVRLEGLPLRVADVARSIEFYGNKLDFAVEINKAPQFAMIRVGGPTGGTIGLLVHDDDLRFVVFCVAGLRGFEPPDGVWPSN